MNKEKIYIAYIEERFTITNGMSAHIIEATGVNKGDEKSPAWSDIEFGNMNLHGMISQGEYYKSLGYCGETCLIFKYKTDAYKRIIEDMICFRKYLERMYNYGIIKPCIINHRTPLTIYYHKKDESHETFSAEEMLDEFFTGQIHAFLAGTNTMDYDHHLYLNELERNL